ncbi:MAG TPA: helix-turn-helix domain-containing protein [Stellaceae bacterium]|nr:helix-turn-helix domain-containing protein [Stellaceae bacterium]
MESSTFADRLWWARHKAGLGATRLARAVKCSQSLISSIERNNAKRSKLNNKFAHALGVDPTWLAHGVADRAPAGFDPEAARKGRESQGSGAGPVVRMPTPAWAGESPLAEPLAPLTGADAMMKQLVNLFYDFAREAGGERSIKLLDTLRHVAELLAFEESGGNTKS